MRLALQRLLGIVSVHVDAAATGGTADEAVLDALDAPDAYALRDVLLREVDPHVIYVSTVTIPLWLVLARAARRPVLCHVHEAEASAPVLVRRALALPLRLADAVVVNSRYARGVLIGAVPALAGRTTVLDNAVPGPPAGPGPVTAPAR